MLSVQVGTEYTVKLFPCAAAAVGVTLGGVRPYGPVHIRILSISATLRSWGSVCLPSSS